MTNINYDAVDETYPIAGQDNNSQGFRDNFSAIKIALAEADAEISTLQSKVLLNSTLAGTDTIANDLLGSSITNGTFNKFYGEINIGALTNSVFDIDLYNGPLQIITVNSDAHALRFNHWPTDLYGIVRVHLINGSGTSKTPILSSVNNGVIKYDESFPSPFTLAVNSKHTVFEAWSYDGGETVFVKYLGTF